VRDMEGRGKGRESGGFCLQAGWGTSPHALPAVPHQIGDLYRWLSGDRLPLLQQAFLSAPAAGLIAAYAPLISPLLALRAASSPTEPYGIEAIDAWPLACGCSPCPLLRCHLHPSALHRSD